MNISFLHWCLTGITIHSCVNTIPSNRWPTLNKLNDIFGVSCLIMSCQDFGFYFILFYFYFILPNRCFAYIYIKALVLCFYGIRECANECISASISVSCGFSWALLRVFILSYSDFFVFVFFSFIYYPLDALFSLKERQKDDGSRWKGRW